MKPKTEPCYCGGKVTEWKSGTEIYLQCDRCQLRTSSYGNTEQGIEQMYFFWNNKPEIKKDSYKDIKKIIDNIDKQNKKV